MDSPVLGYEPGEIQNTVTGMGKGLIAYDRWASDPAQAAGESVFNIATFFIPVGGAAAGTAKAASLVGKTAQVVGVAGKAAKVADVVKASRVADVVAGVRTTLGLRLNNAANALHTVLGGPDRALAGPGRLHLPEAPVPHTPDLHATTIHPDAPAAPHPDGPTSHGGGAPPHGTVAARPHDPGREAVVRDERGNVEGVPGDPAQTLQRRVELGFPENLSDPRASPLFPPGYDPLHGHSVDQAIHDLSNGSRTDGSPVWDYANQAPDGGKIVGDARYPVNHDSLSTGFVIDRFGSPKGSFASPEGVPYPSRGLPPDAAGSQYHRYQVVRDIPGKLVETSYVEEAFYEGRGVPPGVQFSFSKSIDCRTHRGGIPRRGFSPVRLI